MNSSSFEITSASNSSFDRESTSTFYLNITARDIDGLSSTAGLVIVIDDVNDNIPTFNESQSVVAVNENSTIGHKLKYIRAYDKDYGSNSVLSYTMRGGDEKFIYNHTTGGLSQEKSKDLQALIFNHVWLRCYLSHCPFLSLSPLRKSNSIKSCIYHKPTKTTPVFMLMRYMANFTGASLLLGGGGR